MEPKLTLMIDASALRYANCWRRFLWTVKHGYRPVNDRTMLIRAQYGTSFHKFLELWYKGVAQADAIGTAVAKYTEFWEEMEANEKEFRTPIHLMLATNAYTKAYPRGQETLVPGVSPTGTYYVEEKFSFPFYENENFLIMLCGTRDMKGSYGGITCIADHKTTAISEKYFFDIYKMDIQTMFYVWFEKYLGLSEWYLPILVNGIFIKTWTDTAAKEKRFDGVNFNRGDGLIEYTTEQMEQFQRWLFFKLDQLIELLDTEEGEELLEYASCKTPFGLCQYFKVCSLPPSIQPMMLNQNFKTGHYNPLLFGIDE